MIASMARVWSSGLVFPFYSANAGNITPALGSRVKLLPSVFLNSNLYVTMYG